MIHIRKFTYCSLTMGLLLFNPTAFADNAIPATHFQVKTIPEGVETNNNVVIQIGCTGTKNTPYSPVIGEVVIFPDGTNEATVTVAGAVSQQQVSDFLLNWPQINKVVSHDVFSLEGSIGTTMSPYRIAGFWVGNGATPLDTGLVTHVPFSIGPVNFNPNSCAKTVTMVAAVADVCYLTKVSGFNEGTVNLWTPVVGSNYDGNPGSWSYNKPPTLTIARNLTTNPLPASCGNGVDVTVTPTARYLNDNMIAFYGVGHAWPVGGLLGQ